MNGFFYDECHTTLENIRKARMFFKEHPDGIIKTGTWPDGEWNLDAFYTWYWECLDAKINRNLPTGRKYSSEYQQYLRNDRRTIEDNLFRRINMRGTGMLRTKELQKRYPDINCNLN